MYETLVTMAGWVVDHPVQRRTGDSASWVRFRLKTVERRYDPDKDDWVNGNVMFISVHCWRSLADNALSALKRGDPVIVHGRMRIYGQSGELADKRDVQIDAYHLGLDLSRANDRLRATADEPAALAAVA
ncbi:single-stranded DNA-binding protein [Actinokineospora sp. NPDC004072]